MTKYTRAPSIWKLQDLIKHCNEETVSCGLPDGTYVPARPLGFDSWGQRVRAAYLAFSGKADVVIWSGGQ